MRNHSQILTSSDADFLSLQGEFNFRLITSAWASASNRSLFNNIDNHALHKYSELESAFSLRSIGSLLLGMKDFTWNSLHFIPKLFQLQRSAFWNVLPLRKWPQVVSWFLGYVIRIFKKSFRKAQIIDHLSLFVALNTIESYKWS